MKVKIAGPLKVTVHRVIILKSWKDILDFLNAYSKFCSILKYLKDGTLGDMLLHMSSIDVTIGSIAHILPYVTSL